MKMQLDLYCGDSLEVLRTFKDNSFHSLVTDPPAGIDLLGKEWDNDKGGRDQWINWLSAIFRECLRVLRPGAFGVIWAIPRTSHWTAMAAENAGFEIRDIVHHLFGSGMPMGQNISKALDKRAGVRGNPLGTRNDGKHTNGVMYQSFGSGESEGVFIEYGPESLEARNWFGWHTRLKPAVEHWILVRKPVERTVIDTILLYGVGALNIEACRVPRTDGFEKAWDKPVSTNISAEKGAKTLLTMAQHTVDLSSNKPSGGFPANLVLSHADDCILDSCVEGCPVKALDHQSGNSTSSKSQRGKVKIFTQEKEQWIGESTERGFKDSGGASRFFNVFNSRSSLDQVQAEFSYYAKANNKEKFFYCKQCHLISPFAQGRELLYKEHKHHEGFIAHPTPKASKLMEWLVSLVTPPNGIVLDPFLGTGATGDVCKSLGFNFVGIDLDPDYLEIAGWRLKDDLPEILDVSSETQVLPLYSRQEVESESMADSYSRSLQIQEG